ncbi:hypothetical protein Ancab_038092, partial [Ancistrocladus abbreviatus]
MVKDPLGNVGSLPLVLQPCPSLDQVIKVATSNYKENHWSQPSLHNMVGYVLITFSYDPVIDDSEEPSTEWRNFTFRELRTQRWFDTPRSQSLPHHSGSVKEKESNLKFLEANPQGSGYSWLNGSYTGVLKSAHLLPVMAEKMVEADIDNCLLRPIRGNL